MSAVAQETQGVCWDLSSYFPEFNGPDMVAFREAIVSDIAAMTAEAGALGALSAETADAWEQLILRIEKLNQRMSHILSYVGNLNAAHSDKEEYSAELARLSAVMAEGEKLDAELLRAFKGSSDADFERLASRESLAGARYSLERIRQRAQWSMSLEQEQLAADLGVDGLHAWGRLYDTLSGKLTFEMRWPDGRVETLPISQWRALLGSADRAVGRAAFEGGNRAWAGVEDVCAAALNGIAGTRHVLNRRRGVPHFLDMALFQSAVERETLDAMYSAIHADLDIARDIFRIKGARMGRRGIAFWEREAPLPLPGAALYGWEAGSALVSRSFAQVYPALAEYYEDFLNKRWMESERRPGKRPGAYCTGSSLTGEQRVYMTFNGTLNEVSTIAHELGHAFHSHLLKHHRPMQQRYPMTLAETASIFAEQILAEGVYEDASIGADQKLLMLDADLAGAAILLLDITVRFEFEKAFYEERAAGEVSVSRLKELMVGKQREVLGDALEEGGEDPYFWASKLHFYISRTSFYNFPYTMGFLLARKLFARFKQEGAGFLPKYEEFLRLTGSASVEDVVAQTIGGDTRTPEFWAEATGSLAEPLALYKRLLAELP